MKSPSRMPVVMTIAGSDSGGGAGIQADLKVFAALRVFGTTAITCVTAQNPRKVAGIVALDPQMVALQIKTVCDAFPLKAVKTGMLYSADIIKSVSKAIQLNRINTVVVDPVMIATSGGNLMQRKATETLCSCLLPIASVITPNISEAETLSGLSIRTIDDMRNAAKMLCKEFGAACVVKGGHIHGKQGRDLDKVVDVLCNKGRIYEFRTKRVPVSTTHGTGCRFSAALTAYLARGTTLLSAVGRAQQFVAASLKNLLYQ
jgi:hydroxymethylpyrimidine/phosphomethylpyrimidine kinase